MPSPLTQLASEVFGATGGPIAPRSIFLALLYPLVGLQLDALLTGPLIRALAPGLSPRQTAAFPEELLSIAQGATVACCRLQIE